jgi:hypothetical protein
MALSWTALEHLSQTWNVIALMDSFSPENGPLMSFEKL